MITVFESDSDNHIFVDLAKVTLEDLKAFQAALASLIVDREAAPAQLESDTINIGKATWVRTRLTEREIEVIVSQETGAPHRMKVDR